MITKVGKDGHIAASSGGDLGRILVLDFGQQLQSVNDRLRFARLGCTIEVSGDRLVLRATLPPKPGREGKASQQRLYIGMKANPRGLKAAEAQAKRLGGELAEKSFDWRRWGWEPEIESLSIGSGLSASRRIGGSGRPDLLRRLRLWTRDTSGTFGDCHRISG